MANIFSAFFSRPAPILSPRLKPVMVIAPDLLAEPRATNELNACLEQIKSASEYMQAHLRVVRAHIHAWEAHELEVSKAFTEVLGHRLASPEPTILDPEAQRWREELVATARAMAEPVPQSPQVIMGTMGMSMQGQSSAVRRRDETLKASPAAVVDTQTEAQAKMAEVVKHIREAPTPS